MQRLFRNNRLAKQERQAYLEKRKAAVIIQTYYQAYRCRLHNKSQNAAKYIQNWWRSISLKRKCETLKETVVKIQRLVRRNQEIKKEQRNLAIKKSAVIKIQHHIRGYRARQNFLKARVSAILIQCQWRMYIKQKHFTKLKMTAIYSQKLYRKNKEAKKCRLQFLRLKSTVIFLQNLCKGKLHRTYFITKRQAVITIQASWKSILARKNYLHKKEACVAIQKCFRNFKNRKDIQKEKLLQEVSARHIQNYWRNYRQRESKKQEMAAICIQSVFRGLIARRNYGKILRAAVCIQAYYRGYRICQRYQKLQKASSIIQSKWRATILTRTYRRRYLMTYGAVITIQAAFRGFSVRENLLDRNKKCVKLQALIRGWLQREKYLRIKCATLVLQDYYRSHRLSRQTRDNYVCKRQAIVKIQKWYRLCKLQEVTRHEQAACVIQSWYKCERQKRIYHNYRSKVILSQACVRGVLVRRQWHARKCSVVVIQRAFRTFLFVKNLRRGIAQRHACAKLIQKTFRSVVQRRRSERRLAAIKIQKMCRGYLQRKCYMRKITSIVLIQRRWRIHHSKILRNNAATKIQKHYRCYAYRKSQSALEARRYHLQQFCQEFKYHISAVKIQRCYRKHMLLSRARNHMGSILYIQRAHRAQQARRDYQKLKSVVIKVQHGVRRWIQYRHKAASVIQTAVRKWLVRHQLQKHERNATKIQALWKGYILRKKTYTKKMAEIRRRISKANESACEKNKLGNRTASALDYLLRYKDMSYILEAVMHLDVVTRLSPRCCERMVEVNAVCVIYRLMRSLNRSLPHMDVIRYSINILLNLAKYDKTIDYVYNVPDSVSNLLDLMTIYREKGQIFNKTCTLVGILALDTDRRQAIVTNHGFTDKIRSIYALTARKHKLKEGRNLVRAKMAASKSFNRTLPLSTPAKKKKVRPDWLLNRDSIRDIDDPMKAIKFVMDNLSLVPK